MKTQSGNERVRKMGLTRSGTTGRSVIATGLLLSVIFMSGCALSFGYKHADWMVRWQLDHYLDLSTAQRRDVSSRMKLLLVRHRLEALPRYEQFLHDLQQRVAQGLTPEDLDWLFRSYDALRGDLLERLLPDGSAVLTGLTESQIRHLEQILSKEENKEARALARPVAERADERSRKILDLVEEWIGPLTPAQSEHLRRYAVALSEIQREWWRYWRQRHQELVSLLRQSASPESKVSGLRRLFGGMEQSGPEAYFTGLKELRVGLGTLLLEMDRLLTLSQRRKAVASLQALIDEIHKLAQG